MATSVEANVSGAWEDTKGFFGFGKDDKETDNQNNVEIDNVSKNHTIVDVNIKADGGTVTDQNATSTGGRVKLNTASNGV